MLGSAAEMEEEIKVAAWERTREAGRHDGVQNRKARGKAFNRHSSR